MTLWPRITISPTSPSGDRLARVVDDAHLDASIGLPIEPGLRPSAGC